MSQVVVILRWSLTVSGDCQARSSEHVKYYTAPGQLALLACLFNDFIIPSPICIPSFLLLDHDVLLVCRCSC